MFKGGGVSGRRLRRRSGWGGEGTPIIAHIGAVFSLRSSWRHRGARAAIICRSALASTQAARLSGRKNEEQTEEGAGTTLSPSSPSLPPNQKTYVQAAGGVERRVQRARHGARRQEPGHGAERHRGRLPLDVFERDHCCVALETKRREREQRAPARRDASWSSSLRARREGSRGLCRVCVCVSAVVSVRWLFGCGLWVGPSVLLSLLFSSLASLLSLSPPRSPSLQRIPRPPQTESDTHSDTHVPT
jgi:hypothetical protein